MMNYIDELRRRYGYKISEFTAGINSARTYSRYMNGQSDLPYQTFLDYLSKLNYQLHDFFFYIDHEIKEHNHLYFDFLDQVEQRQLKEAYETYEKLGSNQLFGKQNELIRLNHLRLQYYAKKVTAKEAKEAIDDYIDIHTILGRNMISREEIYLLLFYMRLNRDDQQQNILHYLERIVIDKTVHVLALNYDEVQLMVINSILEYLMSNYHLKRSDHIRIKTLLNNLNTCITDGCIVSHIELYFHYLIEYSNKIKDMKRRDIAIYHLVLYELSKTPNPIIKPEYRRVFKDMLNQPMFSHPSIGESLRFDV